MKSENRIFAQLIREETIKAGRVVLELSLSSIPPFSKRVKDVPGLFREDVYSAVNFESIHNLYLVLLKLLKPVSQDLLDPEPYTLEKEGCYCWQYLYKSDC